MTTQQARGIPTRATHKCRKFTMDTLKRHTGTHRATTAGNYQYHYQTNITINIYYHQLQNYKPKQANKHTKQTITFRINHQQQFQDYQALQPFRNKFSGTTLGICLSVKQESKQENKTNIRSHPPHFRESATWHGHLVKPTGQG